jgi:hypothetical protein
MVCSSDLPPCSSTDLFADEPSGLRHDRKPLLDPTRPTRHERSASALPAQASGNVRSRAGRLPNAKRFRGSPPEGRATPRARRRLVALSAMASRESSTSQPGSACRARIGMPPPPTVTIRTASTSQSTRRPSRSLPPLFSLSFIPATLAADQRARLPVVELAADDAGPDRNWMFGAVFSATLGRCAQRGTEDSRPATAASFWLDKTGTRCPSRSALPPSGETPRAEGIAGMSNTYASAFDLNSSPGFRVHLSRRKLGRGLRVSWAVLAPPRRGDIYALD